MKAIIAIWFALTATTVWATCTTNSYMYNGKYTVCTTCCYGGNCQTTCM